MMKKRIAIILTVVMVLTTIAAAMPTTVFAKTYRLSLNMLFSVSTVAQGAATPKTAVQLTVGGKTYRATTSTKGKYTIKIPKQKPGNKVTVRLYTGKKCVKTLRTKIYATHVTYKDGFSYHKIDTDVKKRITGKSYKTNPNINLNQLRYLNVKYYDFKGKVRKGELIVNLKIARDMLEIFHKLYLRKYRFEEVSLVDKYGASDGRSMAANNTSAFNYRVIAGTNRLSRHAYGMAIDINPRINPYVANGKADPDNGSLYKQRNASKCKGKYRNYMIHRTDYVYKLFKSYGFEWGGDWKNVKDYQHFEKW